MLYNFVVVIVIMMRKRAGRKKKDSKETVTLDIDIIMMQSQRGNIELIEAEWRIYASVD